MGVLVLTASRASPLISAIAARPLLFSLLLALLFALLLSLLFAFLLAFPRSGSSHGRRLGPGLSFEGSRYLVVRRGRLGGCWRPRSGMLLIPATAPAR